MNSRRTILIGVLPGLVAAQAPQFPQPKQDKEEPTRLPNGKLQQDEILKQDYKKTLADCKELLKLAQDLEADIEKSEQFVMSVASIKHTEDIEKLARRIRGRIKRS